MKRAVVELCLLLALMLVGGTVYNILNASRPKKHLAWVNPMLPRGIPRLPGSAAAARTPPSPASPQTPEQAGNPKPAAGQDPGSATPAPDPEGFRFIEDAEALQYYEEGVAVFIDARRTKDYVAGHITGALSIAYWEEDAERKISELKQEVVLEQPIVAYCSRSRDCEDSQHLARQLFEVGFQDVMVYRGGFPEWEEKRPELVTRGSERGEK